MKIHLKTLTTFVAVAENASFRKAAEKVHLSLPAVSMQIKQLEERVGVSLFERTTRRVNLTPEGEHLLAAVRHAMAEIDTAVVHIRQPKPHPVQLTSTCPAWPVTHVSPHPGAN